MARARETPNADESYSFRRSLLFSAIATALLVIAISALWFSMYIFNSKNFTSIATESVLSDSSRTAIAARITDRVLEDRPVLRSTIDEQATQFISGLLNTDAAHTVISKAILRLHTVVTSSHTEPIEIDLTSLKGILGRLLEVSGKVTDETTEEQRIQISDIPDSITLIDTTKLPNTYAFGVALLWLGPLCFFAALTLLAWPIYKLRHAGRALQSILTLQGIIICVGGIFALLLGPLFKPPILAQVPNENGRIIVDNLYTAFIGKFEQLTIPLFLLGLGLIAARLYLRFIRKRHVAGTK